MPTYHSNEWKRLKRVNLTKHEQECGEEDGPNVDIDIVDGDKRSKVNFIIQKILYVPQKKGEITT